MNAGTDLLKSLEVFCRGDSRPFTDRPFPFTRVNIVVILVAKNENLASNRMTG
jgi:hypothetical protein